MAENDTNMINQIMINGITYDISAKFDVNGHELDKIMPTDISFDTSTGSFALRHDGTEITGQDTKANIKSYVEGVATAIVNAAGSSVPDNVVLFEEITA